MSCTNKKCGQQTEPLLDRNSDDVCCSECGEIIQNVSPFAKNAMKGMNQYKNSVKAQQAFSVSCAKCAKNMQPTLVAGKLQCPACSHQHQDIQPAYAHAIKQWVGKKGQL